MRFDVEVDNSLPVDIIQYTERLNAEFLQQFNPPASGCDRLEVAEGVLAVKMLHRIKKPSGVPGFIGTGDCSKIENPDKVGMG